VKKDIFMASVVLALSFGGLVGFNSNVTHHSVVLPNIKAEPVLLKEEERAVSIYDSMKQSVVIINGIVDGGYNVGTGAFITDDGLILTAKHVVVDAKEIIIFFNGVKIQAKVEKLSKDHDLATLRISPEDLKKIHIRPLPLEDPKNVLVGRNIYLLGHPFGISSVFTQGFISKMPDDYISGNLQINGQGCPGNSGGPVVDSDGKILGVLVSIYRKFDNKTDSTYTNISFAEPIENIIKFLATGA
jgi:S1-C subfamily serine protease